MGEGKLMAKFKGFTDSETFTQVPNGFFRQLLKQIDDAAELKVTLYFLWRIEHMDGPFRALSTSDFSTTDLGLTAEVLAAAGLSASKTISVISIDARHSS